MIGKTTALTQVVVAARKIKYGEIISPDMISLSTRDISEVNDFVRSKDEVLGGVSNRTIAQGTIIDLETVEKPPLVKRGELVKIIVQRNGLKLTAIGIAKSNGKLHEVIRVKNSQSNKLIHCKVQAPGLVEVII